jgi:hypothetical protein
LVFEPAFSWEVSWVPVVKILRCAIMCPYAAVLAGGWTTW